MPEAIKLGLALETWRSTDTIDVRMRHVQLAERVGFHSVWTSEAYGADALTPLAYLAAGTTRIRLGTSVVQVSARTATATAMAFATLDALAGGDRVIAGLGVSGPRVIEGWYGAQWSRPLARMRDYISVMRKVFEREGPLRHYGETIQVPYAGPDAVGNGVSLKSILHPRPDIPIYVAAGGPESVTLAAEFGDGWLSSGLDPWNMDAFQPALEKGLARSSRAIGEFEIHASTWVEITSDLNATFAALKRQVAFYIGSTGPDERNYHLAAMKQRGYGEAARRVFELYRADRREKAANAVPDEYCDDLGLFGSPSRIRLRFEPWAESGITLLSIRANQDEAIELMAGITT